MKKFLIFLFLPFFAQASGIQATPPKLELQTEVGKPLQVEILVQNPSADIQVFEIYLDEFKKVIKTYPESFTLQPGEQKRITITIEALSEPKILSTFISVVGKPLLETKFQANAGVKIPLTITVLKPVLAKKFSPLVYYFGSFALIVLGLIIFYLIQKFIKKKPSQPQA